MIDFRMCCYKIHLEHGPKSNSTFVSHDVPSTAVIVANILKMFYFKMSVL